MNPQLGFLLNASLEFLRNSNLESAELYLKQALRLEPNNPHVLRLLGVICAQRKQYLEALQYFNKSLKSFPKSALVWSNLGNVYLEMKEYGKALEAYDKSIKIDPKYEEAWSNKGNALYELKRFDEAIAHHDKALNLNPNYFQAWSNKGNVLIELKQFDEAIAHFDKALSLNPCINWVYGDMLHAKMKIADWSNLDDHYVNIAKKVLLHERVAIPFSLLPINDDAGLHQQAAQIFAQEKYPENPSLGPILKLAKKEKIRIAYFSPDFRSHPVSFLTSELFEIHDRNRFEVVAFSLQKAPIGDETHERLKKGFDQFIEVDTMSDQEIAQLARELQIDIAIDLAGPTQYARTKIFSYRAAPIQVNWLGYPGTIGANFIDYIVADQTIIPQSHEEFYSEKVVRLPNTYMVDDSKRLASSKAFTKQECGLPENAFIFCCFNNDYKFNPRVLDSWSRILLSVENSILWISENNAYFRSNIAAEFERRGIRSDRIIFAKRMEMMSDHLARYSLADLFLDTHPYSAHTTALDSLKTGIPILTYIGQSFASRVVASLLNAIDMPELIASNQTEYEALAIELATNPTKLAAIKQKLIKNRLSSPLFDTPLFTRNLETAYIRMYEKYQAELPSDHIVI